MDNSPKIVDDVAPHAVFERSPELEALIAKFEELADAKVVADNAQAVVIIDDAGKEVRHLNLKLSAMETMRVMAMPVADRAKMATYILQERRIVRAAEAVKTKEHAQLTRKRKVDRKRKRKNKRRSR